MASQPRILLTAFEPFGVWKVNASRLCLDELLPLIRPALDVATRIYPVDFQQTRPILEDDLQQEFDLCIHLGQSQHTGRMRLEAVGLNVGVAPGSGEHEPFCLIPGGPAAYEVALPLAEWAAELRAEGIPTYVSHHAGTYLCNATLYWARHFVETRGLKTQNLFIHVPLDVLQVANLPGDYMTLPSAVVARGVARIIDLWSGP